MRIYSGKKMMALDRKLCDIDTRRDVYLTPAGGVVRAIYKLKQLMKLFGYVGPEMEHLVKCLEAMESKKKALVVTDTNEQFEDWHLQSK